MKRLFILILLVCCIKTETLVCDCESVDPVIKDGVVSYNITINTGVASTNPNEVSLQANGRQDPHQEFLAHEKQVQMNRGWLNYSMGLVTTAIVLLGYIIRW